MFCPTCRAEFRPEITHCPQCDIDLVPERPASREDQALLLQTMASLGQAACIAKAGYREATQMVERLQKHGLAAMLTADCAEGGCKKGCCGGPSAFVTVLSQDVPAAMTVLQQAHRSLVAEMGNDSLKALDAEVNMDAEGEKSCPACGTSFTGTPAECPDCGLYLGAI